MAMMPAGESGPNTEFLRAVLRWSLRQQDPAGSNDVKPMSSEDREWLSKAMSQVESGPSEVDVIKKQLHVLRTPVEVSSTDDERQEDLEKREAAVETLTDLCDHIDNARDLIPLCGFPVIKALLQGSERSLIWRTAELVATLAQNNPVCQMAVVESGLIPILLDKLRSSDVDSVRVKCLYAISCVIKDHTEAHQAFVENDGYSALVDCLASGVEKLIIKAVFLMGNLCNAESVGHDQAGDALCKASVIERLASFLASEHAAWHEHVAGTLLTLATEHEGSRQRCRQPELKLAETVRARYEFLLHNCGDESAEEKDHCKQLLLLLR